jgi:hypothetical protein
MTDAQIRIRWIIAGAISLVLLIVLAIILPKLPAFSDLKKVEGTIDTSTVETRSEGGKDQPVYAITLEGAPDTVYAVVRGTDAGFYRATQTVASGDEVILWTYPIPSSNDKRIWQLSDRNQLIVDYNEVYGVEKHYRTQIILVILLLLLLVNGVTYFQTLQATDVPDIPPMLELEEEEEHIEE